MWSNRALLKWFVGGASIVALASCGNPHLSRTPEEGQVLSGSSFYPQESQRAQSQGGGSNDGGFIPAPTGSTSGDGGILGRILGGSAKSGGTSSGTASSGNSSVSSNTGGASSSSGTKPSSGGSSGSGGSPTGGTGTSVASGSSGQPSDGGVIAGPTGGKTGDGGNIGTPGSGNSSSGSTASTGGTSGGTNPSSGTSGSSPVVSAGGSNPSGSSSQSGSTVASGSTGGSSPTNPSDGGVIPAGGGNKAPDSGSITTQTSVATNPSGPSTPTGGSTGGTGGNSSNPTNPVASGSNGSKPAGDGGLIPPGSGNVASTAGSIPTSTASGTNPISGSPITNPGGNTGSISGNTGSPSSGSPSTGSGSNPSTGTSVAVNKPDGGVIPNGGGVQAPNGGSISTSSGTSSNPTGSGKPSGNNSSNPSTGNSSGGNPVTAGPVSTPGSSQQTSGRRPGLIGILQNIFSGGSLFNSGSGGSSRGVASTGGGNNQGGGNPSGSNSSTGSSGNKGSGNPVGSNPGGSSSSGSASNQGGGNPGSSSSSTPTSISVGMSRVCSDRRSQTDYEFFEEAKNPIMVAEALMGPNVGCGCSYYTQSSQDQNPYSINAPGYGGYSDSSSQNAVTRMVLGSISLSSVNLMNGKAAVSLPVDMASLQAQYPGQWQGAMIAVTVCDDVTNSGNCDNASVKQTLSVNQPGFQARHEPSSMVIDVWNGRNMNQDQNPDYCEKQYSPLVLDLSGNGFKLTAPENGVQFDLNNTGVKIQTAWLATTENGFLVRDINHDGQIDNGSEMFGTATRLKNGQLAANGFEALKDLDSNGDGVLDKRDPAFRQLRVWIDKNFDGVSDPDELYTLRELGIEYINLAYIKMAEVDPYGNQTRYASTYERRMPFADHDNPLKIIDVWFNTLVAH